jgi:guanylate kinase
VTFPVLLAGPSGAGKTSIRDRLLSDDAPDYLFSVSMTTRAPRTGEVDGADYRFVTRREFGDLVGRGEVLEHAEVHGELYGTPRMNLDAALDAGRHLLLDIDVQGARQVRKAVPETVSIFVVPPSGARVLDRLRGRASETPEQLRRRLESACRELDAVGEFDYLIVNDDLGRAVSEVRAIVTAESRSVRRADGWSRSVARSLRDEIATAMS